jgi:hypothetical protein
VLVANSGFGAAYTDVDVARFGWDATTGTYQLMSRLPEYAREFDADCLLYENYIPNLAVMHTREAWDRVGGFDDAEVDLLGDWDFLVRLAHEVRFVHVARRTAEVRVYEGGSLSVLRGWGQPDELRIREAMFHRHRDRYAPEVQLRVFHEFKRRTLDAEQRLGQHAARSAELARELTQVQEELAGARAAHGYQVQQLEQQAVQLEEQTRQREQQTHKLEVQTHQREQQTHQLEEQAHQLEQQTLQLEHQALQLEQQTLQLDRQASQLEHRADQLAQQAVEPEPLAAPEPEPLAPASNGGAPTPTTAQRRRVAMARVASCVRDPARATRWARVALEDPALALARLRGRR